MTVDARDTLAHLRRLEERRRAEGRRRAERFRGLLPEAARILRECGADRVLLFGSLATGDVHPSSDVDLAVEGLSAVEHIPALADLQALFGAPVDLVRLEEASPPLRERILEEGQVP